MGDSQLKKARKTNPNLNELISELKRLSRENEAPIWRDIARRLERPSRVWPEVNIAMLDKHLSAKDFVIVPGKLLGTGTITKPVNVAAYSASASAVRKVERAGGRYLKIIDLAAQNPKGSGVRIMG
jgi:large subunit ribosomal protein L18e